MAILSVNKLLKSELKRRLKELKALPEEELIHNRIEKFSNMGVYSEEKASASK